MSEFENRRMLLAKRPVGEVRDDDFTVDVAPVPTPGDGEIVVRVIWIAFDPAMRGWMNEGPSYAPPVPLGSVMRAHGVGEVVVSGTDSLQVGTLVSGNFGWQQYALARVADDTVGSLEYVHGEGAGLMEARRIPDGIPPTAALGVLGLTGLTAYFGMLELGGPKPGDVVLVSGAAGATGSVAGQLAKMAGATVIGIAGGPEKTRWLEEVAGFHHSIDYKQAELTTRIGELAPDGVDLFYDNVAGPALEAGIANIAMRGNVILCGGISSGYSKQAEVVGPRNLAAIRVRRGTMRGFIVTDFADRFEGASERLAAWIRSGDIVWADDVQQGPVESAVATLNRLFAGKNLGKQLLQTAEPSER